MNKSFEYGKKKTVYIFKVKVHEYFPASNVLFIEKIHETWKLRQFLGRKFTFYKMSSRFSFKSLH